MKTTPLHKNLPTTVLKAWKLATKIRLNAYAPYSHFLVGSALKFKNNKNFFVGCNFENASYGATICAERNAIGAAIAQGVLKPANKNIKKNVLEFVIVVTNTTEGTPPCGMCLQVLSEFADQETMVYLATHKSILQKAKFNQFLPTPFNEIEVL
jgi:cytidine deaminase